MSSSYVNIPIISDDVMVYVKIFLNCVIHGLVAIVGISTNLLNMLIFSKLGLKDSMIVGLFVLSLTDFSVTFLRLASVACFLSAVVFPSNPIDLESIQNFVLAWTRYIAYQVSCWITAMLTVERCFCVVSPFRVKQTFTRGRCIVAMVTIYVIHYGLHVPVYMSQTIDWEVTSGGANNSQISRQLTVLYDKDIVEMVIIVDVVCGVTLSVLSQAIVIICTAWMIYSLGVSSRIRLHNTVQTNKELQLPLSPSPTFISGKTSANVGSKLSTRERKLVRVVVTLAVILTFCNLPRFATIIVDHVLPGVEYGEVQENLGVTLWEMSYFFGTICCSVNFLVYYTLNSSYRKSMMRILRLKKRSPEGETELQSHSRL